MDDKVHKQLRLHLERGKNQLIFSSAIKVLEHGQEILKKYIDAPIIRSNQSILKFVQTHRDNYLELAGIIIELKGWLITHPKQSTLKTVVIKRISDLIKFYRCLLSDLNQIGKNMATLEGFIEDESMTLNSSRNIANQILAEIEEVTIYISQDIAA